MTIPDESRFLDLPGLDGSNPLGFLAAVGTLRLLDRPNDPVRLGWHRAHGAWTARLASTQSLDPSEVAEILQNRLRASAEHPALARWDDLNVKPEEFRSFVLEAARSAAPGDREWADFAVAFGSEVPLPGRGKIGRMGTTAFRMTAGQQHFLTLVRHVLRTVDAGQVSKALFEAWTYDDPRERLSLRWDPADDIRYALRWSDPSTDPERKKRGSMVGANALAVHALPLFPTTPVGSRLATTGFSRIKRRVTWTWPIWEPPLPLSVVRTLVALPELQEVLPRRDALLSQGVVEIFRSERRITVGKYRNFTPAEPAEDPASEPRREGNSHML